MTTRRHVSMESPFTPLAFSKNPSTATVCPGQTTGRRGAGEANPNYAAPDRPLGMSNRSTFNIFATQDENQPPSSAYSSLMGTPRSLRGRYHNRETVSPGDFPNKGIRRIEPPRHTEHAHGLRMVNTPNSSRFHSLSVVGDAVNDPLPQTPRSTPRVRPASASAPIADSLRMDGTFGSENPDEWGCPNDSIYRRELPPHDITAMQRIRLAVCDHVQQRAGSLSNFFFQLARGAIGNVSADLVLEGNGSVTVRTLQQQLQSLLSTPITEAQLAAMCFRLPLGEPHPDIVTYKDFATAFGDGPTIPVLRAHKI